MSVGAAVSALVFLGLILALCDAQEAQPFKYQQIDNFQKVRNSGEINPLVCYDCNSAYDPRCADPFNNYSIATITCSDKPVPEQLLDPSQPNHKVQPQVCRKQIQTTYGQVRVIRGCGYIKDKLDDKRCYKQTGGGGTTEVIYCACTGSLCNTGQPTSSRSALGVTVTLAITRLLNHFLS